MSLLDIDAARLEEVATRAVAIGRALGADTVVASASASAGIRVKARGGEVDTALRDARQGLSLTLYRGAAAGNVSTAALDDAAIHLAAEEAFALAGITTGDLTALPPDLPQMATYTPLPPLHAPSGRDAKDLRVIALAGDAMIRETSAAAGITIDTVAADVSTSEGITALATSAGFCRSQIYSTHGIWAVALARDADGAANDSAGSSDRRYNMLEPMRTLADTAVARAVSQLGGRAVASHRGPVLFEARAAAALLGDLIAALTGSRQHAGATFLPAMLGRSVAAAHLDLSEDPFEAYGLASGGFDGEGIAGSRRAILNAGVAEGYFLGVRSARQLGMTPTGNAGGPWNLRFTSRTDGGSFDALCRRMERGLVISRIMGGATDPVTGNWTYAVSGTWMEGGMPTHAVADVTVGGNLRDMLMAIDAVGDDVHRSGAIRTGSLLIDGMQIGGAV